MTRSLAELRQYLAGEWLFDNDFKDTSRNGNHGTPTDIEWASTNRGLKPRFNGSSSFVNCGNDSSLSISSEMSISFKFRPTTQSGSFDRILSKVSAGTGFFVWYNASSNAILFNINNGNSATDADKYIVGTVALNHGSWNHVVVKFSPGMLYITVNGVEQSESTTQTAIVTSSANFEIGRSSSYISGNIDDVKMYSTLLTTAEAAAINNATSGEYGVRIAEFSYQHDPATVIPVTADTVLQIGGKLAGDAVDTISDRALSNDATIHGAMPTGDGFLAGGRRFDATVKNAIVIPFDSSFDFDSSTTAIIHLLYQSNGAQTSHPFGRRTSNKGWMFYQLTNAIQFYSGNGIETDFIATSVQHNVIHALTASIDVANGTFSLYQNGILVGTKSIDYANDVNSGIGIGAENGNIKLLNVDGIISLAMISKTGGIVRQPQDFFNTLAVLPFWSISYTDYPDNVTTYTDRFPHSFSIIASGAFKVDDDKLTCTSAGTLTYSASNEFDGAEYITVTIAGTKYSGTGTITQGNTTVSVAQGSNKITVAMGTGDTIDKIRIQFRATV